MFHQRSRASRCRTLFLVALAGVVAAAPGATAFAQTGGYVVPWAPGFETQLRTIFSRRLVEDIGGWFHMSDDQYLILEALREDHMSRFEEFAAGARPIRDEFDERIGAKPAGSLARFEIEVERETELAEIADRQEIIDMEFLASIKSILDEAQVEQLKSFRAWLNRRRWNSNGGRYMEQSLDLIAMLREVDEIVPDAQESITPEVIREYESRLDRAILDRTAFAIDFSRHRFRSNLERTRTDGEKVWLATFAPDPKKLQKQRERRFAVDRLIRDVNHEFITRFGVMLPDRAAGVWRRLFREAIIRRVYYDSGLSDQTNTLIEESVQKGIRFDQLVIDVYEHVTDLSTDQRETIEALQLEYDARVISSIKRIIRAHDEGVQASFHRLSQVDRDRLEADYRDAIEEFAKIEKRSVANVVGLLSQAQQEMLDRDNDQVDDS